MKTRTVIIRYFFIMTALTGIVYPFFITIFAQVVFPDKANGSMVSVDGKYVGSLLIGQSFDQLPYFTSRPSAVSYNPLPSGASNLSLTNRKLIDQVEQRKKVFIHYNQLGDSVHVPSEMVFASGSGLDPHISIEAALLQVPRVAQNRSLDRKQQQFLKSLVYSMEEPRQFGLLGEPRINVLMLNLKTDHQFPITRQR
jgi:potassium-transporting ATPase KdpC subunit